MAKVKPNKNPIKIPTGSEEIPALSFWVACWVIKDRFTDRPLCLNCVWTAGRMC